MIQASCTSCSNGLLGGAAPYLDHGWPPTGDPGCGEAGCYPGRPCCAPCVAETAIGRLFCAFHDCVCCPDPCYEPRWVAAANAAFFVDHARPTTMTRLRYTGGTDMTLPDRSEYFWAAIGQSGPRQRELSVDYDELSLYQETGIERFSFFIEMPYRLLEPQLNPGAAGFGDLNLGTKSLLLDCELMQITFQFRTYIPTGAAGRGLGTGRVRLEPSLLFALKLYPDTYLQGQISEWIPIGGTGGIEGSILHYHFSLNRTLCYPVADSPLVGTLEFNGYAFQAGGFTDPVFGPRSGNGTSYMSFGPGIRQTICNKLDFGFGAAFSLTNNNFAETLFRGEIRFRF